MPHPTDREPVHEPKAPIVSVDQLTIKYGSALAVDQVTFALQQGDQVAVIGPNGAGKSTLFKAIAGILSPTTGFVQIGGSQPMQHICIAYIPQRSQIDWSFPVTVADAVLMGRVGRLGWLRRPRAEDRDFVQTCLRHVRMDGLANRRIDALSGGEQQRMFIARALAQEAEVMLMDEVMSACDVPSQEEIYRILAMLKEQQVTIMVSTHDLDDAAARYDQVMLLNRQLIGFGSATDVFTPEKLKQAYGGHLRLVQTAQGLMVLSDATCCGGGEGHQHG